LVEIAADFDFRGGAIVVPRVAAAATRNVKMATLARVRCSGGVRVRVHGILYRTVSHKIHRRCPAGCANGSANFAKQGRPEPLDPLVEVGARKQAARSLKERRGGGRFKRWPDRQAWKIQKVSGH